jgi:hypothetical protein
MVHQMNVFYHAIISQQLHKQYIITATNERMAATKKLFSFSTRLAQVPLRRQIPSRAKPATPINVPIITNGKKVWPGIVFCCVLHAVHSTHTRMKRDDRQ